jgi:4a-hydroxytetrahydrobiopterin dehydratase
MSESVMSDSDVEKLLGAPGAPNWELVGGRLVKVVACDGFVGSLAFVNAVGELAEQANHHPDIDIRYNRVTLSLLSHDSGGITSRDIALARSIDGVSAGVRHT